jgi:DNA-directed RNA polymerase subunit RPC12/RpoP
MSDRTFYKCPNCENEIVDPFDDPEGTGVLTCSYCKKQYMAITTLHGVEETTEPPVKTEIETIKSDTPKYGVAGLPINEWQPMIVYRCPHCFTQHHICPPPKRVDISCDTPEPIRCPFCGKEARARGASLNF